MRALLLAAGRGERMRPLSDATAKPLLAAGGRRLIEWQIGSLVRAGITDIVINTAHLAQQIEETLGDGSRYGAHLRYSREGTRAEDALETLGGIVRALPLLGDTPFVVASGDIVTRFDYGTLHTAEQAIASGRLDAHLVLVPNPPYHPRGDMGLAPGTDGIWRATRAAPLHTYANIAVLPPRLFDGLPATRAKLFPWMFQFVEQGRVGGELWEGTWWNIGTPQDLAAADKMLS